MQWVTPVDDTKCISFQIWGSEQEKGPYTIKAGKYRHTEVGEIKRIEDGWWNIWDRDQDDAAVDELLGSDADGVECGAGGRARCVAERVR